MIPNSNCLFLANQTSVTSTILCVDLADPPASYIYFDDYSPSVVDFYNGVLYGSVYTSAGLSGFGAINFSVCITNPSLFARSNFLIDTTSSELGYLNSVIDTISKYPSVFVSFLGGSSSPLLFFIVIILPLECQMLFSASYLCNSALVQLFRSIDVLTSNLERLCKRTDICIYKWHNSILCRCF